MNIARMRALFKREITDIFRDKKTMIMMVLLPLLLYPTIIVIMTFITTAIMNDQETTVYKIAFENVAEEEKIAEVITNEDSKLDYKVEVVSVLNAQKALENKDIDAYVTQGEKDGKITYQICYLSAVTNSSTAAGAVFDGMDLYREALRKEAVLQAGLDEELILYPIAYAREDLSSTEESMGNIIGGFIPVLIIISICLGAIYPAIDVTAGERERGTLETLLTLPVTNFEMIMSKFLAVSVIACISAVINILSLGGAFGFMISFVAKGMADKFDFASFLPGILFTMLLMIVFALFVTAACMCVCVFAKSFKEANNYITPLLLIFMFGGYAGAIPKLELSASTAAVPIINVTLLIKDLFNFKYNYALFGIVLLSNVVYSLLTIMILGKLYNSENILFGEGFGSVKLFTKRSEMKKAQLPGYGDVILLLCLQLLLMFYVGSLAQVKWGLAGVLVSQAMILIIPLAYAWYIKTDMKKLFSIRPPKVRGIVSALCMFLGGYMINLVLSILLSSIFKESTQNVNGVFEELLKAPIWAIIFILAVLPAIGEELMFRGFILGSLKGRQKILTAMILSSAVFGLYHMSLVKLIPTAFLGFLLAALAIGNESIIPAMLMHFLNNLTSVLIVKYEAPLSEKMPDFIYQVLMEGQINQAGIAIAAVLIGALFILGSVLLMKKKKTK